MIITPSHYSSRGDSSDRFGYNRNAQPLTPSKRDKYDNYTPRKRYIKEQEEYDSYRNLQGEQVGPYPQHVALPIEADRLYNSRGRATSIPKKDSAPPCESKRIPLGDLFSPDFEKLYSNDSKTPLQECTVAVNCTSVRKSKFKGYLQDREICKKICFEDSENRDCSNIAQGKLRKGYHENKQRFLDIQDDFSLTPRRLNKRKDDPTQMNQKRSMLQAKLVRLERMTPKKCSTPRATEQQLPEFSHCTQRQDRGESMLSSRVSAAASERQNEIMSRVSLGRLVQQQECEPQIQVIQDLSYKISSKLRSIIRHFG